MALVLVVGLTIGSIYGLLAMGLVLTFRTSGIYNLAHGAMALFGTVVYYRLTVNGDWGVVPAFLVCVLAVGPAVGLICYLVVFRWVRDESVAVVLVASIAVLGALSGFASNMLPAGNTVVVVPKIFPSGTIEMPGGYHPELAQLGTIVLTGFVALFLGWFLQRTHFGLKMRACVDARELTELTGDNTNLIQLVSWMFSAAVATLSGILIANALNLTPGLLTLLVIQASAGAVIGKLSSLPLAYLGGIVLGLFETALARYLPASSASQGLRLSAAFIILYLAIVLGATVYRAFAQIEISEVAHSIRGQVADPSRLLPTVVLLGAIAVGLPFASPYVVFLLTAGLIASVMFQGFVLITGMAGQVSLAPAAFMALGGVTYAQLTTEVGLPAALALVLAVAATVVIGLAIGIPAVRVRGLPLVLLTFAFGLFVDRYLMSLSVFGANKGSFVDRLSIFGWDLDSPLSFAYLVAVVALGAAVAVRNLASGRTGRILAAAKSSEVATESFGTSVRRAKLLLFSLSTGLAAVAGILSFMQLQVASPGQLTVFQSILFLTLAVVGGVGNPQGAIVAGLLLYGVPDWFANQGFEELYPPVFAALTLVVLMGRRGGLADFLSRPVIAAQVAVTGGRR